MEKKEKNTIKLIEDKLIYNINTKDEIKLGKLWSDLDADQLVFIIFLRRWG